jgi:hypothetical protein
MVDHLDVCPDFPDHLRGAIVIQIVVLRNVSRVSDIGHEKHTTLTNIIFKNKTTKRFKT